MIYSSEIEIYLYIFIPKPEFQAGLYKKNQNKSKLIAVIAFKDFRQRRNFSYMPAKPISFFLACRIDKPPNP